MELIWASSPFGIQELEPQAAGGYGADGPLRKGEKVRCCINGCHNWMSMRSGKRPVEYCPEHGVSVSTSPTYVYRDWRSNFLIGRQVMEAVKKDKVESWRLGNEASEDAVSWNTFLSLAHVGGLREAFHLLAGERARAEPKLFFWGVEIWPEFRPGTWRRLVEAREHCAEGASGIRTEPDIMLLVEGQALVLVEAKFGSPNGTLAKKRPPVPVADYLKRYAAPVGRADPLERSAIAHTPADQLLEQLCRNVLFANYMAGATEQAFVANLVRSADESDVKERMDRYLCKDARAAFRRVTWEDLARLPSIQRTEARVLKRYLQNKTLRLQPAFNFG